MRFEEKQKQNKTEPNDTNEEERDNWAERQRNRGIEQWNVFIFVVAKKNRIFSKYHSFDFEKEFYSRSFLVAKWHFFCANCRCFVTISNWFTVMYLYLSAESNCTVHMQTLSKKHCLLYASMASDHPPILFHHKHRPIRKSNNKNYHEYNKAFRTFH